jgi:uncharacterized protein DUF3592
VIKKRRARQWFIDGAAIITLLVFVVPVGWLLAEQHRLSTDGPIVTGIVRSKAFVSGRGEISSYYSVSYSFTDASGREQTGSGTVDESVYDKVSPGDALAIQYLPDGPSRSRAYGTSTLPEVGEPLALAAVGIAFFYFLGPQRWLREWRGKPDPVLT